MSEEEDKITKIAIKGRECHQQVAQKREREREKGRERKKGRKEERDGMKRCKRTKERRKEWFDIHSSSVKLVDT